MMAWLRGLLGKSIQYERVMMNASTKRRMPGLLRRLADELDAEGTAGAVQVSDAVDESLHGKLDVGAPRNRPSCSLLYFGLVASCSSKAESGN